MPNGDIFSSGGYVSISPEMMDVYRRAGVTINSSNQVRPAFVDEYTSVDPAWEAIMKVKKAKAASEERRKNSNKKILEERTKKPSEADLLSEGIATVIMAIREELMNYYKGTCVERFASINLIQTVSGSINEEPRSGHNYERREAQNRNFRLLAFNNEVIAELSREPDTLTLLPGILNRSPEMNQVYEAIKTFMGQYLGGVELKEDKKSRYNKSQTKPSEDPKLMRSAVDPNNKRTSMDEYLTSRRSEWIAFN